MTKELSIDQLQALVTQLERDNSKLKKNAKEMQHQIDLLISKLNLSNSKRFGKQSEKAPRGTFNEAESTMSATEPKHHNKGKKNLPEHLEREVIEYKLEDTNCDCCGHQMHVCGSEESEQIKIIPAKISFISKLYQIENQLKAKGLSVAERYQLRQDKARPILNAFKLWLDETNEKLTNKSYIAIAVQYTLNQWEKLIRYIEDGELGIDNNITERDIRPFTTGRKNWMFCQSVKGAEASAVLYSIVMTCRTNDINSYYYFLHLFKTLPNLGDKSDLTALMPWNVQLDYVSALA